MQRRKAFHCQACGGVSARWMGRCPSCGEWNTLVEEVEQSGPARGITGGASLPESLAATDQDEEERLPTGLPELDRVLGGGLVAGSLILLGGDPGVGKSTILLQAVREVASRHGECLYLSGEESVRQVRLRAGRMGKFPPGAYVLAETNLEVIKERLLKHHPVMAVVDSIQTIYKEEVGSAPGSVAQVRECAAELLALAKTSGICLFLVGHVTKDGMIAGPKVLEHMVDTVLYFEGERGGPLRLLRSVKNRFGPTDELGIFQMSEEGLMGVANPSEFFLGERRPGISGSTVVAAQEGSRPLLVELQALIVPAGYASVRRIVAGLDYNRVCLLLAVLEKRLGLPLGGQDAYLKVAGGVKLEEPAADLGIVLAATSSFQDVAVDPGTVCIGEVGLSGEVRGVHRAAERAREAVRLGFNRVVVPEVNRKDLRGMEAQVRGVETVAQAMEIVFSVRG